MPASEKLISNNKFLGSVILNCPYSGGKKTEGNGVEWGNNIILRGL